MGSTYTKRKSGERKVAYSKSQRLTKPQTPAGAPLEKLRPKWGGKRKIMASEDIDDYPCGLTSVP